MFEVDTLTKRSTLAWPVECDHRETKIGQRQQEGIEFFDEGIVAAVEDKRCSFLAFGLQTKARQVSAGIRHLEALVTGGALHRARPVAGEVIVECVARVASGKIKLRAVVVGCG